MNTEFSHNCEFLRTSLWFENGKLEYENHYEVGAVGLLPVSSDNNTEFADFSNGYVLFTKYKVGVDSFSVGIRLKYDKLTHDAVLFSNSKALIPNANGFNALLTEDGVTFRIGNGLVADEFKFNFEHKANEWFTFIVSVDRENKTVTGFFNYEKVATYSINGDFKTSTLDALDLAVGTDGSKKYPFNLEASVSQFMIYKKAIREEDIPNVASLDNQKG